MKKHWKSIIIASIIALSIASFIYLNAENPHFALFQFNTELPSFNVKSSTLPDVEAIKSTLIFIKEVVFFDI